jgi:hypothetical protein
MWDRAFGVCWSLRSAITTRMETIRFEPSAVREDPAPIDEKLPAPLK